MEIWLSNTTEKFQNSLKNFKTHKAHPSEFSNFSVSFQIFQWCLSQIPNPTSPQNAVCTKITESNMVLRDASASKNRRGPHFAHFAVHESCTLSVTLAATKIGQYHISLGSMAWAIVIFIEPYKPPWYLLLL